MSIQDINKIELREISNRKHGRIISRFEPLGLCPRLHHYEGFSLKINLARSLSATTHIMSSFKNSWTRKSLTCSHKNNTHEHVSSPRPQALQLLNKMGGIVGDLFSWSPTNTFTTRTLEDEYRNEKLKLVWEKLDRCFREKLKKSLLKTQEKHSW